MVVKCDVKEYLSALILLLLAATLPDVALSAKVERLWMLWKPNLTVAELIEAAESLQANATTAAGAAADNDDGPSNLLRLQGAVTALTAELKRLLGFLNRHDPTPERHDRFRRLCGLLDLRHVALETISISQLVDACLELTCPGPFAVPLRYVGDSPSVLKFSGKHRQPGERVTCDDVLECLYHEPSGAHLSASASQWSRLCASLNYRSWGGIGGRTNRTSKDVARDLRDWLSTRWKPVTSAGTLASTTVVVHEVSREMEIVVNFLGWFKAARRVTPKGIRWSGSHGEVTKLDDHTVRKTPLLTNKEGVRDFSREAFAHQVCRLKRGVMKAGAACGVVETVGNLDHGSSDYLDLEYLPLSLQDVLTSLDQMEEPVARLAQVARLASDVARGLLFLHIDCELMHLDVSENNIRCTVDGRAKLIDLSSAIPINAPEAVRIAVLKRNSFVAKIERRLADITNGDAIRSFGPEVDVLMFGRLLESLLSRANVGPETLSAAADIRKLPTDCSDVNPNARPSMTTVVRRLEAFAEERLPEGQSLDGRKNAEDTDVEMAMSAIDHEDDPPGSEPTAVPAESGERVAVEDRSTTQTGHAALQHVLSVGATIDQNTLHSTALGSATVMTFNVRNLSQNSATRFSAFIDFLISARPRIVMLQELRTRDICQLLQRELNDKDRINTWVVLDPPSSRDSKRDFDSIAYCNPRDALTRQLESLPIDHLSRAKRLQIQNPRCPLWARDPVAVKLVVGKTRVTVISLHLNPTKPTVAQKANTPAEQVVMLASAMRHLSTISSRSMILLGGDFNLHCDDVAMLPLRTVFSPTLTADAYTNKKLEKQYDNVWVHVPSGARDMLRGAAIGPGTPLGVRRYVGYAPREGLVTGVDVVSDAVKAIDSDHAAVELTLTFYAGHRTPGSAGLTTMTLPNAIQVV